jgi:hypothetical protein
MERQEWMHTEPAPIPGKRPRILVEDDGAPITGSALAAGAAVGADVIFCHGPDHPGEACPLVTDGACPAGTPDVVVCALGGPWRRSIEAAWRADRVPVAAVDPDLPGGWASRLGAALAVSFDPAAGSPAQDA